LDRYGVNSQCTIAKAVSSDQNEEVWLELNFHKDREQLDMDSARMQQEKEEEENANELYKEFMDLISPGSCIEGGFSRVEV
jgi:hypothetical protein